VGDSEGRAGEEEGGEKDARGFLGIGFGIVSRRAEREKRVEVYSPLRQWRERIFSLLSHGSCDAHFGKIR
jgi:hypothetical protein